MANRWAIDHIFFTTKTILRISWPPLRQEYTRYPSALSLGLVSLVADTMFCTVEDKRYGRGSIFGWNSVLMTAALGQI